MGSNDKVYPLAGEETRLHPIHLSLLAEAERHGGQAHANTHDDKGALGKLRMYGYVDGDNVITPKGRKALRDFG